MEEAKHYYIPPFRSIVASTILVTLGIGFFFLGIDAKASVWFNVQQAFISSSFGLRPISRADYEITKAI